MSRLQDIADQLHLSVSLVSKVLNGRLGTSGVSPETVRHIRRVARDLNYQKHSSAAALAMGRQNVVGLYVHRMGAAGSGIVEAIVHAVAREIATHGQRLVLHFFERADEFLASCPGIGRHAMDGLIAAGVAHAELVTELKRIQDDGIPVVTLHDNALDDPALVNVGTDQREVGRLATAHLIAAGCRRIAHVRFNATRAAGYFAALEAAGIPRRDELVRPTSSYQVDAGRAAVADLLDAGVAFDGLVAQSDNQAAGAIHELLRRGRRVPDDVRVIGVDNAPFCDINIIPISSVECHHDLRAARAVELLMAKLAGRPVAAVEVPPAVIARASSGGRAGADAPAASSSSLATSSSDGNGRAADAAATNRRRRPRVAAAVAAAVAAGAG